MSDDKASLTVLKAQRGLAVKKRTRSTHGRETKSDPTLTEFLWRMARVDLEADVDHVVRFLLRMALRQDLTTVHGVPAPGISPNQWVRRLSAEAHGANCTLIEQTLRFIPFDVDDGKLPQGSALDQGQNLYPAAEYARETFLPPALRDVDMAIGAASSSGFKAGRLSLHGYVILDRSVSMQVAYKWMAGAQASGFPLDPRPLLPGQLFLTGRPLLFGLDDPVPPHLHAFVLPGRRQRATSIDWNEFNAPLATYEASERRARAVGAELGWQAVIARHLGDGPGKLGFFKTLSIALGYAARSGESADEIVGKMHAVLSAHPDLTSERKDHHTPQWLRTELMRLRAKDAAREASIDVRIDTIRGRFPRMSFWHDRP
jgi:hypothetical protein